MHIRTYIYHIKPTRNETVCFSSTCGPREYYSYNRSLCYTEGVKRNPMNALELDVPLYVHLIVRHSKLSAINISANRFLPFFLSAEEL